MQDDLNIYGNNSIAGDDTDSPEMDRDPSRRRTVGYVVTCDNGRATIAADVDPNIEYMKNYWAVGQVISIKVAGNRVIAQTIKVNTEQNSWEAGGRNRLLITVELIGEVQQNGSNASFTTGISNFPHMGCEAHRIRSADLAAIYQNSASNVIEVGHLTQDASIPAKIDVDKLLSRHFAIVGSTGVGKSTAISLVLRKVIEARPEIRVLVVDPHNEYSTAFNGSAVVITANELKLPFWMFEFEEFAEVIFRGQEGLDKEREMLRDMIVLAKERYQEGDKGGSAIIKRSTNTSMINANTPVPYRIVDLVKGIDERLGLLDGKHDKPWLKSLKDRIESIATDTRFRFMFDPAYAGGDRMQDILSFIFRIPNKPTPISVLEMSGLPSEVVNSVVSVVCRLAFDMGLNSDGGIQTLVVCEEAHRYIPADTKNAFWPTRQSIGRIAKEGRKYGVYLGIVTQRPSEVDATILSQCNTFFAMRLSNHRDQEIIAEAFNSGASSTISFLPLIANREAIAFGEALYTPMRLTFQAVREEILPGAHIRQSQHAARAGREVSVVSIVRRLRGESGRIVQTAPEDLRHVPGVLPAQTQREPGQHVMPGSGLSDQSLREGDEIAPEKLFSKRIQQQPGERNAGISIERRYAQLSEDDHARRTTADELAKGGISGNSLIGRLRSR